MDEMMEKRKINKGKYIIGAIGICLVVLMAAGAVAVSKFLLKDSGPRRKRQIKMVNIVKPPPPPKIKEKPPEPEIKKQKEEEMIDPAPQEAEPEPTDDSSKDEPPPGEDLGLDADGAAGADGFGLRAKKGARSLIGGGGGGGASLMHRYGWYTKMIQEELSKRMKRHMEENGGIPDGNMKVLVQITLDDLGKVVDFSIAGSSGNKELDKAVVEALKLASISEPPPSGMPRRIKLKISARG